ncbi:MAG: four helix bundle protein [Bacteroidetes bacterium]|nr:four helix bundle protein [Bacteroidota bacterium]
MENTADKNNSFFRFEDLRIYHKAIEFVDWTQQATSYFPEDAKTTIGVPMSKAAQAIVVNIAEGSARNKSQFVYYLKMAKSAVRESVVYTTIAKTMHFISDETEEEGRRQLMELTKMIGALIASLQKAQLASGQMDEKPSEEVDFED